MKLNKVLIYLAILVVIVTYVYMFEIRKKQAKLAADKKAAKLVDLKRSQLAHIVIKSKEHGDIELKKPTDNWVLVQPVKSKCDDPAMSSWTRSITGAERESVVAEKDVKWSEFGFDDPILTVTIGAKDKTAKVAFGARNPAKTSYYARVDSNPELLLVADTLKNSLDKSAFDLRDKTVVAVAQKDVERIVYSQKRKQLEIRREGATAWRMITPQSMRVKSALVDQDVLRLTNLKAREIIDIPKSSGDPYGLKEPVRKITLSGPKLGQTLLIGKHVEDKEKSAPGPKKVYAQIEGREPVYVVDDWVLTKIVTDPEKLQDKSLFSFDPAEIDEVELKLNGKTWVASRNKDKKWSVQQPTQKDKVDTWLVTSVLWDLKDLQWEDRKKLSGELSSFHLDQPKLVATLSLEGKKEPIVFRVGWNPEPPDTPAPKTSKQERTSDKKAPLRSAAKSDQGASKPPENSEVSQKPTPKTVYATVTPHEDQGAVFTLKGAFLSRVREDLDRLAKKDSE